MAREDAAEHGIRKLLCGAEGLHAGGRSQVRGSSRGDDTGLEQQVLIFAPVCISSRVPQCLVCLTFLPFRQCKYDLELLDGYRQALEVAVNLSVKHNLPPLPGRTFLFYLTDCDADHVCPKSNTQGVKGPSTLEGLWGAWELRGV